MAGKKILFICGSYNQTTMMHQISHHLPDCACHFTPFYADGFIGVVADGGMLDFSILGGQFKRATENYLREHHLQVDFKGAKNHYDLVVTCTDLIIQRNIRDTKVVLVQEGMTDPKNIMYHLVRRLGLPRYLASTSTTGLSDAFVRFCVASEGYRDLFIRRGVRPEKIAVTGIPNFDHAEQFLDNDFPHRGYVLAATSDARETFKYDNRKKFIHHVSKIADGRPILFKLHPNENVGRATREIMRWIPGAVVFHHGNTNHMIANCDVLITQYSSVAFVGLALGKEVHSYFNLEMLKRLVPIQNGGMSAKNIAEVCKGYLG